MRVKFTANETFAQYNGAVSFFDGDVKEVTDEQGAYLIKTWPENFAVVETEDDPGKRLAPEGKNRLTPTGKNRKA